jgi:hypothetical protein
MKAKCLFFVIVLIPFLVIAACSKNENDILQTRTLLELARTKSDLDGIFIAVNKLMNLGDKDPELPAELGKVKKSLQLFELIRVSEGDKTHEKTIQFAHEFLAFFPNNVDVRIALRESGRIFGFLNESLRELRSCFYKSAEGKFTFISAKETEYSQIDFEIVTQRLGNARKAVEEALKLDQNFETALNLRKLIMNAQVALCHSITKDIFTTIDQYRPMAERTFDVVYKEMQESLHSRYGSPQKAWKRSQSVVTSLEETNKKVKNHFQNLESILCRIDTDENECKTDAVRNAIIIYDQYVKSVVYPRGTLLDYKNDFMSISSKWSELVSKYKTSEKNMDNIVESVTNISNLATGFRLYISEETPIIIQERLEIIEK